MKNFKPLCIAIVDALLVFENSSADEMDPDLAVRAMENMSSSLQLLDAEDQRELRNAFRDIARSASNESYSVFVMSTPDMLGLEE